MWSPDYFPCDICGKDVACGHICDSCQRVIDLRKTFKIVEG